MVRQADQLFSIHGVSPTAEFEPVGCIHPDQLERVVEPTDTPVTISEFRALCDELEIETALQDLMLGIPQGESESFQEARATKLSGQLGRWSNRGVLGYVLQFLRSKDLDQLQRRHDMLGLREQIYMNHCYLHLQRQLRVVEPHPAEQTRDQHPETEELDLLPDGEAPYVPPPRTRETTPLGSFIGLCVSYGIEEREQRILLGVQSRRDATESRLTAMTSNLRKWAFVSQLSAVKTLLRATCMNHAYACWARLREEDQQVLAHVMDHYRDYWAEKQQPTEEPVRCTTERLPEALKEYGGIGLGMGRLSNAVVSWHARYRLYLLKILDAETPEQVQKHADMIRAADYYGILREESLATVFERLVSAALDKAKEKQAPKEVEEAKKGVLLHDVLVAATHYGFEPRTGTELVNCLNEWPAQQLDHLLSMLRASSQTHVLHLDQLITAYADKTTKVAQDQLRDIYNRKMASLSKKSEEVADVN